MADQTKHLLLECTYSRVLQCSHLAQQLSIALPLLAWPAFQEIKACHPDALCHKGEALGLPPPETLTLNTEQYILLCILLDGSIEGGRDLYILMAMINGGIQGMFVQTRLPCTIQYPESHHAEISMWMKISVVKKDCGILTLSSVFFSLFNSIPNLKQYFFIPLTCFIIHCFELIFAFLIPS